MSSKRNMRECVRRCLWGRSVQENCGSGWLSLNGERGDCLTLRELQMYLRGHSLANFNVLLDWFIVIQASGKLMSAKRNMSKGVCGRLGRLTVQENGGAGRLTLNRQGGDFLSRFQLHMDLGSHPSTNLNILPDRLVIIQGCGKQMSAKGNMSKGVCGRLRGLAIQENCGASRVTLHR